MHEVIERLTRIETRVTDIHKRVCGNGQPGLEQRVSAIEQWRAAENATEATEQAGDARVWKWATFVVSVVGLILGAWKIWG